MSHPSSCSQHQVGFVFGHHPRKPVILKHGNRHVMIWAAISSILLVIYLLSMVESLPVTTWTVQVARCNAQVLFHNSDANFQDDNIPIHTPRSVQSWSEEHEDSLQYLLWLAHSPNINIIESLCLVLESRVGSRFRPSSLKQLEEEWYSIPLETIQNLDKSIPRRIQDVLQSVVAQLHINKEICIFHGCFHYFCPSPVHASKLYSVG
jgi:hypothetical protein